MSIYSPDEVLDFYDALDYIEDQERALVTDLLTSEEGIMTPELLNRLEAIAMASQADLPLHHEAAVYGRM